MTTKIGGRCPLSYMKNQEAFLISEVENFYKANLNINDIEKLKKIFCRCVCRNFMC